MKPAALALVLALAGCAPAEIRPTFQTVEFDIAGRLGARTRSESFTGNLTWKHASDADELVISTPLGQGVARIARQGAAIVLATAEPREYRATDAELITERVLGFRVPLAGLADWVRGRPSPELAERRPVLLRITYPGIELRLAITQWN